MPVGIIENRLIRYCASVNIALSKCGGIASGNMLLIVRRPIILRFFTINGGEEANLLKALYSLNLLP